jgi:hypothetical protein
MSEYEALLLRYKMAENEDQSYHLAMQQITMQSDGQQLQRSVEMKMTQRATGVNEDGSYNILIALEPSVIAPNDKQQAVGAQTMSLKMSRSGKILWSSVDISTAVTIPFPTHPIFVGEIWEAEWRMNVPDLSENPISRTFNSVYMLTDITTVKTFKCAHISVQISPKEIWLGPGTSLRISGQGETHFAYEEGLFVTSSVETESIITAPDAAIKILTKVSTELESGCNASPVNVRQKLRARSLWGLLCRGWVWWWTSSMKRKSGPASPAALP